MVCNIDGIWGRIPTKSIMHSNQVGDHALESRNRLGQGVVETLWTRGSHMGVLKNAARNS